jgi:hypothetical protein
VVLNGGLRQPSEDATPIRTSESIFSARAEAERPQREQRQATFRRMNVLADPLVSVRYVAILRGIHVGGKRSSRCLI